MTSTEIKAAPNHYFAPGKGTSTPWGCADFSVKLTRGVVWYSTPSHGGLSVTPTWARKNLTLRAQYLAMYWGGKLWFEEDCDCALVFHEHPDLWERFTGQPEPAEPFKDSIRRWSPSYFDPAFRDACHKAGDVPDLLFLQPGDEIKLTGSTTVYRVTEDWARRGKSTHRVTVPADNPFPTHGGPRYRLTDADVQGRLEYIIREGEAVWERPTERPFEAKRQAANG